MAPLRLASPRSLALALALASAGLPSAARAACTLVDNVLTLGRVATVAQLKAMQGETVSGTLVRGTASPMSVELSGCSPTLTTTVRVDNAAITLGGSTVTLAPWLISVNGTNLGTSKDLSQTSHAFVGDATLGLLWVPVAMPSGLTAGQYTGTGLFTFTD